MADAAAACKLIRAAHRARASVGALPPALFLTDPVRTPHPLDVVEALPRGWGVVYRHFGAGDREAVARRLARICRGRHLVLLIAADPRLAAAVGADGAHWPERLAGEARRWHGRFAVQTASAHGPRAMARLGGLPLDALVVSTAFASNSPSAGEPMGALRLRALTRHAPRPLYALGGVNAQTASRLGGACGLAAVEGIAEAFGPGDARPVRT